MALALRRYTRLRMVATCVPLCVLLCAVWARSHTQVADSRLAL